MQADLDAAIADWHNRGRQSSPQVVTRGLATLALSQI